MNCEDEDEDAVIINADATDILLDNSKNSDNVESSKVENIASNGKFPQNDEFLLREAENSQIPEFEQIINGLPSLTLHITNLVRPFSVQNLMKFFVSNCQGILLESFWIDKIKSHCLLHFDSLEHSKKSASFLHSYRWPLNSPKVLSVEFVSDDQVELIKIDQNTSISSKLSIQNSKNSSVAKDAFKILEQHFKKTETKPYIFWKTRNENSISSKKSTPEPSKRHSSLERNAKKSKIESSKKASSSSKLKSRDTIIDNKDKKIAVKNEKVHHSEEKSQESKTLSKHKNPPSDPYAGFKSESFVRKSQSSPSKHEKIKKDRHRSRSKEKHLKSNSTHRETKFKKKDIDLSPPPTHRNFSKVKNESKKGKVLGNPVLKSTNVAMSFVDDTFNLVPNQSNIKKNDCTKDSSPKLHRTKIPMANTVEKNSKQDLKNKTHPTHSKQDASPKKSPAESSYVSSDDSIKPKTPPKKERRQGSRDQKRSFSPRRSSDKRSKNHSFSHKEHKKTHSSSRRGPRTPPRYKKSPRRNRR